MKTTTPLLLCLGCVLVASTGRAIDLKQAKVTQVVNDVQIISAADQKQKAAAVNEVFTMPDILRTGTASRAELVAQDETVTRVGANTIFSFDPASRTINLKQGSLLFHSPHGKGGGTIRTGSATASVLGTTLIISATPNGGMKVLSLEGKVEVSFLNGLKQKLDPGQMTFVLPGGNQLAPVIIFRLDELTQHSLLVKGFSQPLASLPLILNQIEKQLKLIKSGKAADTGLYAGEDADANKVEVIDPNTVNHQNHLTELVASDATINQPSLTDASIPSPPNHLLITAPFSLPNNTFFSGQTFSGFLARNIYFNTPASGLATLTVDLSPYSSLVNFDFVAVNDISIQGSTTFNGLPSSASLSLIAGNQLWLTPGITLSAEVQNFLLSAPAALNLDGVSLLNTAGSLTLNFGDNIFANNAYFAADSILLENSGTGQISIDNSVIDAPNGLTLTSAGDCDVIGTKINSDANSGSVTIGSTSGSAYINHTSITAHYLTVNSGDGILLNGSGETFTAAGAGSTANFTAPNVITVNSADFSSFGAVNMAANTINLTDVNLGSGDVTLKSLYGTLNVGSSHFGYVNFIDNVIYNGGPAQNYVNNGGGITVTTLH